MKNIYIYLGCFPLFWGVADNTKRKQKPWRFCSVRLAMMMDSAKFGWHCWSNTAHPAPSSTTYVASWMPSPLLPLPQGCSIRQPRGNSRCQSELRHNHSPLIPIPSTLTCLPHTHPPIIQGSLYSIHPPKPRHSSSTSPINFRIHYLIQQLFIIHPLHMTEPSQNIHIYSSCRFSPQSQFSPHIYGIFILKIVSKYLPVG